MLWIFPEYGGQMAVRMNNMKAVRRNLKASKAKRSPWEVYDLANDPAENIDLAEKRPDIIAAAVKVLRQQITPNSVFPMPRPEMWVFHGRELAIENYQDDGLDKTYFFNEKIE